jgi:hypothetical protein
MRSDQPLHYDADALATIWKHIGNPAVQAIRCGALEPLAMPAWPAGEAAISQIFALDRPTHCFDGFWISAGLWTVDDVPLLSEGVEGAVLDEDRLVTDASPVGAIRELDLRRLVAAASQVMAEVERLAR